MDSVTNHSESTKNKRDELYININIKLANRPGVHSLKVKVDTGAQGNILPLRTYRRMYPESIDSDGYPKNGTTTKRNTVLTAYNGTQIPQHGSIKIPCKFKDWHIAEFFVAESEGPVIMGLPSCQALELVTVNCEIKANPEKIDPITNHIKISNVQFTDDKLSQFQMQTNLDETLHYLKETIMNGWPDNPKMLPKCIRHYWSCRNELSIDDGMIFKGERIIVPESMKNEVLQKLHTGHQGIIKCQSRAKSCVFWPGINKEIDNMVSQCSTCQQHSRSQPHEPLIPHEIPQRP